MDWLVYWYIDDYIELTDQQEDVVDAKLTSWLAWHKRSEIPKYIAHLNELSKDIKYQQLSLTRMDYHQQKSAAHWLRLKAHIIPDLVEMAPMLSKEQVASMFNEIDKLNKEEVEEREERLAKSPEKQKKESIKRNKKNLQRWLGKLSTEQEKLIENMYGEYHSTGELWLQYKIKYQAELKVLFDGEGRGDVFKLKLEALLMTPEIYRSELLNQKNVENGNIYKTFLLAIDALSTEKQRLHLLEEITDFSEDFSDLLI